MEINFFLSQFAVFITYHFVKSCTAISMFKMHNICKRKKMVLKPVHLCQKMFCKTSVTKDLWKTWNKRKYKRHDSERAISCIHITCTLDGWTNSQFPTTNSDFSNWSKAVLLLFLGFKTNFEPIRKFQGSDLWVWNPWCGEKVTVSIK